jgi:hypothetical protein
MPGALIRNLAITSNLASVEKQPAALSACRLFSFAVRGVQFSSKMVG